MDEYDPDKFPHRDLTRRIIGVHYDVFNELGFGFPENVYHRAMVQVLKAAGLDAVNGVGLPVYFRGESVGEFVPDILVNRCVILELKAVESLWSEHESQLMHYLKFTEIEVGLLMNFGPQPVVRRMAFLNDRKRSRPEIRLQ